MSKQLFVDPKELRAPGKIQFEDIPVNQYNKTILDEKKANNFSKLSKPMILLSSTFAQVAASVKDVRKVKKMG